jgi:ADP-glucose pyrophosphorylase
MVSSLLRVKNINANSRAKLEGCILGKNTKVGSKADVVRCITQAGYEISAGGK